MIGNLLLFSGVIILSVIALFISTDQDDQQYCVASSSNNYSCNGTLENPHYGKVVPCAQSNYAWQVNTNNTTYATWIFGCVFFALFFFYGICRLDKSEKSVRILKVLIVLTIFGWIVLSICAGVMGIEDAGQCCRGALFYDETLAELEEYSWWSLEPLRLLKYSEVVPGYDKRKGTFVLWMGMMLVFYAFAFFIYLCSCGTWGKVRSVSDLVNDKPRKIARL